MVPIRPVSRLSDSNADAAFQPEPSMSRAPRDPTWKSRSRNCAGQLRPFRTTNVGIALFLWAQLGAAIGTVRRHDKRDLGTRSVLNDGPQNLRDDLPCLTQEDHVADQDAFALDLAFAFVQGCHGHGRSRNLDRLHHGKRRNPPRSTNVDLNIEQPGTDYLRRVLGRRWPSEGHARWNQPP